MIHVVMQPIVFLVLVVNVPREPVVMGTVGYIPTHNVLLTMEPLYIMEGP